MYLTYSCLCSFFWKLNLNVYSPSPPPPALFQIHVRTNLYVDVFIGGSSSIINKDALFGTLGGILHWGIEPCLVCVKSVLYHWTISTILFLLFILTQMSQYISQAGSELTCNPYGSWICYPPVSASWVQWLQALLPGLPGNKGFQNIISQCWNVGHR